MYIYKNISYLKGKKMTVTDFIDKYCDKTYTTLIYQLKTYRAYALFPHILNTNKHIILYRDDRYSIYRTIKMLDSTMTLDVKWELQVVNLDTYCGKWTGMIIDKETIIVTHIHADIDLDKNNSKIEREVIKRYLNNFYERSNLLSKLNMLYHFNEKPNLNNKLIDEIIKKHAFKIDSSFYKSMFPDEYTYSIDYLRAWRKLSLAISDMLDRDDMSKIFTQDENPLISSAVLITSIKIDGTRKSVTNTSKYWDLLYVSVGINSSMFGSYERTLKELKHRSKDINRMMIKHLKEKKRYRDFVPHLKIGNVTFTRDYRLVYILEFKDDLSVVIDAVKNKRESD